MAVEEAIQALLRSSEEVKVVLETVNISPSTTTTTTGKALELRDPPDLHHRRVLAVVSHRDDWKGSEEGSIFICKYKASTHGTPKELETQHVFPIAGNFSISMAQVRRRTIDLGAQQPRPAAGAAPANSGFSLTIKPDRGLDAEPDSANLTYFTNDVQLLRATVHECKRLKEATELGEGVSISQSSPRFRWLLPYTSQQSSIHILSSIPQDLRFFYQPLHNRLSPASAGLSGDDAADIALISETWVLSKAREMSRKGRSRISVRIGTFNVNGKLPSQDLSTWLSGPVKTPISPISIPPLKKLSPLSLGEVEVARSSFYFRKKSPDSKSENSPPSQINSSSALSDGTNDVFEAEPVDVDPFPDIFALGFQELDLSTEALLYSTSSVREDAWCTAVFASLGEKGAMYEKLASKQLVGMLIIIMVKKSLRSCFSDITTSAAGAGILGVLGNKGGTAVRLKFTPESSGKAGIETPGPTILTFVNAHLAAFDDMVDKRNSDFQDLSRRLSFDSEVMDSTGLVPLPISVYESDALFWMGDLNYRIDLPDNDIRAILRFHNWEGRYASLLRFDQLKKSIRNKQAFVEFSENHINHIPTYRFSPGVPTDGLGYDLKRKPAWTDRILYMNAPSVSLQQLSYTAQPQITMSDHRPVAADFLVEVDLIDKDLHDNIARRLFREVGYIDEESSERTSIKLDTTSLDFGQVMYRKEVSRTVRLQNNSKVPCAYRFVPLEPTSEIHPQWMSITPMHGLILPSEVALITLTAYVDNNSAPTLNLSPKTLEATLILHTILGKDHFISVTGEYQYTCFSNELSRLTRLPGPIRSLTSPSDLRPENHPLNAPREIMRLVNWMMSEHASIDGLFILPAKEDIVDTIRECLDTGEEFPIIPNEADTEVHLAFAVVLLRLLDSLVEPIVPVSLHSKCTQMTSRDEAFEVCDLLTNIFTPILLRDDLDSSLPPVSPLAKRDFLMYFIS
ncbi:Endonuclease/exonuclease/phosphatase [Collybia nuda]|uniref:Endonuclease/exonuclease/phosphatase n=1 Tax=Collybia nuda TaxID=64659 RepID=A0A9P5Y395_9AGAR|nr:Endonuclease/exonuclease/phosphatase [Collybia nuda]